MRERRTEAANGVIGVANTPARVCRVHDAVNLSVASIVNIGNDRGATEWDLRNAIDERTAAVLLHDSPEQRRPSLEEMLAIARVHNIPMFVDAAFSVPPKDTLWKFTRNIGVDAVIISGGKGLRGPQCTGLVLGKPWIVKACAFHGVPNDRIGRGMKVGKEELAGIYAAVKCFMEQDEASIRASKSRQLDYILVPLPSCVLPQSMCRPHFRRESLEFFRG